MGQPAYPAPPAAPEPTAAAGDATESDPSEEYGTYQYVYATPTGDGMGYWLFGDVDGVLATINDAIGDADDAEAEAEDDEVEKKITALFRVVDETALEQCSYNWYRAGGGEIEIMAEDADTVIDYANAEDNRITTWFGYEEWAADPNGGQAIVPPTFAAGTGEPL